MYCVCTRGHGEGYSAPDEGDVWVHAVCRQIPRYVFDRITNMRVPYHAKSVRSVISASTGHNYVTFHMEDGTKTEVVFYHPYPFKDAPVTEQRDVLYKFWIDLDTCIDRINAGAGPMYGTMEHEADKVRARTYCEMLAYLMHKFYADSNAVGHEAMARYDARQKGVTDHQTPGLAEALWDPRTRFDGTPYSAPSEAAVRAGGLATATKARATGNRIPDTAVDTCKKGIELGMFTVAQYADTYKMTPSEVKAQLGLA